VDEGPLLGLDDVLLVGHVGHGFELGLGDRARQALVVPAAPMKRLASPIRTARDQRTGGKRMRADTNGALNNAARSGWCTAQFLGTASKKTKMTTISNTVAHHTPGPEPGARPGCRPGWPTTSWQMSTSSRTGLRKLAGFSTRRASTGPPALLVDQGLGLDPVHADQAGLGQGQQARGGEQDHDDDDEDGVLGVEARCRPSEWAAQAPRLTTTR
jgi:hypothetical protein